MAMSNNDRGSKGNLLLLSICKITMKDYPRSSDKMKEWIVMWDVHLKHDTLYRNRLALPITFPIDVHEITTTHIEIVMEPVKFYLRYV